MPASTWSKFYGFLMGRPVDEESQSQSRDDERVATAIASDDEGHDISTQESTLIGQIQAGMDLCTADHTKLGTINSVQPPASEGQDAVIAGTREDDGTAVFVPSSAVQEIRGQCVLLKLARAQIDEQGWSRQPDTAAE